jgi:hypothetical protein
MFLDASALTAILAPETDGEALAELHAGADQCLVSALIIWGTTVALARIRQLPIEAAATRSITVAEFGPPALWTPGVPSDIAGSLLLGKVSTPGGWKSRLRSS